MKKSGIIILSIAIIVLLTIAQSILSNILSTTGIDMSKINREIRAYKTENAIIRERLFMESSLTSIESKAKELGFVEGKSQLVITNSTSLAVRQ